MSISTLLNYSSYALALALGVFAIIWFAAQRRPVLHSMEDRRRSDRDPVRRHPPQQPQRHSRDRVRHGPGRRIYAIAFLATRSVWLPLALHLSWNLSQSLWGLPISGESLIAGWFVTSPTGAQILSGGDYGPEASIPGMLARVLIVALVLVYVKRRWPEGDLATLRFAPDPERRRHHLGRREATRPPSA